MPEQPAVILIMAKQPVVGQAKTRLVPFLSAVEAAQVYEALLLDTIDLVVQINPAADLAIAITPAGARPYFEAHTPAGTRLIPVSGANIGECLAQALNTALAMGYSRALALNSDGPSLPGAFLLEAVAALDEAEVVIGPGEDGGFYLIGVKRLNSAIFDAIEWSTDRVLGQTMQRAAALGLQVRLLQPWYDIDSPADLLRLADEISTLPPTSLARTRAILAQLELLKRRLD